MTMMRNRLNSLVRHAMVAPYSDERILLGCQRVLGCTQQVFPNCCATSTAGTHDSFQGCRNPVWYKKIRIQIGCRNLLTVRVGSEALRLIDLKRFHTSVRSLDGVDDGKSKVELMLKQLKEDVEVTERIDQEKSVLKRNAAELKKRGLWSRVAGECKHYYHGFRLLFLDIRVSSRLLFRLLRGDTLLRNEKQQLVRTTSDLFRLVPFLVFIIVPFMEFTLPFFLKFFPNMLPSTFQEDITKHEKMMKRLKVKLEMAKFLQATLEEFSLERNKSKDSQEELEQFTNFLKKIREEGMDLITNEELLKYSKLFEDELTLDNLSYAQLRALCLIVGIQPIGTANLMRFQLRMKIRELRADDKMIAKEGVDSMSVYELQMACRARGMRALGLSEHRLRRQLTQWLELSLNERVPPSLLLLSSSMYLPEETPFADRLKVILSTLPPHIAEEAKIKLTEVEGLKVDNKSKLKVILSIEKLLAKEREERLLAEKARENEEAEVAAAAEAANIPEEVAKAAVPVKADIDMLVDGAPVLKDTAVEMKATEAIQLKDLRNIEELMGKVKGFLADAKEDLEELKEQVQEHKEDVEEVQTIVKLRGDNVVMSKAAKRLQSQVDRIISRMDSVIDKMKSKQTATPEEQASMKEQSKLELVSFSELLEPLKTLSKATDDVKIKRIIDVLKAFDEDRDGAVDVNVVLQAIDLLAAENVQINAQQMTRIVNLLKKEGFLKAESKKEEQEHASDAVKIVSADPEVHDSKKPSTVDPGHEKILKRERQ